MEIAFDEFAHEYRVDGAVFPSVTTILKAEGFIETKWFNDEATARGTAIHEATEAIDNGIPADMYDGEDWFGYVQAWESFKKDHGFIPEAIEKRVASKVWMVAGTVDRMGTIKAGKGLFDIKTGAPQKWHPLQLAAYNLLNGTEPKFLGSPEPVTRYGVYLSKDGKYKLKRYDDPYDYRVISSIFTVFNWKNKK